VNDRRNFLTVLGAGLLAAPLRSFALEKSRPWRVGFLVSGKRPVSMDDPTWGYGQAPRSMREMGYVDGKDLVWEWRFAEGRYEMLAGLAAEIVKSGVDAILTDGSPGIRALQNATTRIPIVFFGGADLVANGFVKSLAKPGGNTTGVTILLTDTVGKQVEIVRQLVPGLVRLAVLLNSANETSPFLLETFQAAAKAAGLQIRPLYARTEAEVEAAVVQAKKERVQAFIWAQDSFFIRQREQIAALTLRAGLPSLSGHQPYARAGGLACYGPNVLDCWAMVARLLDRILKGANPGDLPVEQPTKLELVLNRKTARALGLTIAPELLLLADRVIE
jgi:putative ABC transport system substrate-binding protein